MKYLKYTLLLIILLTFVSVHAETCTYEEKQKLAEDIDLSKLKLTYVKEDKYNRLKDFVKAEIMLDEDYFVSISNDGYKQWITHNYFGISLGGITEIEGISKKCDDEVVYKTEILLPHYNSKNKNVFDDGSRTVKTKNRMALIVFSILLLLVDIALIRGCVKNETFK